MNVHEAYRAVSANADSPRAAANGQPVKTSSREDIDIKSPPVRWELGQPLDPHITVRDAYQMILDEATRVHEQANKEPNDHLRHSLRNRVLSMKNEASYLAIRAAPFVDLEVGEMYRLSHAARLQEDLILSAREGEREREGVSRLEEPTTDLPEAAPVERTC